MSSASGAGLTGMNPLTDLLQKSVTSGSVPGAVALIARGDDVVEVGAAGDMSLGGDAPMQRDTIFRIASITKPITAAATLCLVEDGVFTLDSPVSEWLPELASPSVLRTPKSPLEDVVPLERPITVRHLLSYTTGYGYPSEFDSPAVQPYFTELGGGSPMVGRAPEPDEWMRRLSRIPLLHQPGDAWLYDLSGDITGVLLARATGQPLPDVIADRILEPLGMTDTSFVVPADKVDRLPSFYTPTDGRLELTDPPAGAWTRPVPFPSGSGGLASTLDDWYTFARMLLGGGAIGDRRVLSPESVHQMLTDQTTPAQREGAQLFLQGQGWGFGGAVDIAAVDPWNVDGRYGWVGGSGTTAYVVPSSGLVTILLTQVEMNDPEVAGIMRDFWTYAAQR